jgi:hypothetical protein
VTIQNVGTISTQAPTVDAPKNVSQNLNNTTNSGGAVIATPPKNV